MPLNKEVKPARETFTVFEKNKALKILHSYSLRTGKRWIAIRSEIIRTLEMSKTTTLLVRQDLEHWAKGRNTISDEKFKFIFDFLTHPSTLERNEFYEAKDLIENNSIDRIGDVFADYFNGKSAKIFTRSEHDKNSSNEAFLEKLDAYKGLYVCESDNQNFYLYVDRMPHHKFLVSHFFTVG